MPRSIRSGALAIEIYRHADGELVFAVSGELELGNSDALGAELSKLAIAGRPSLTIDLTELEFIDSSGLALLIFFSQRYNGRGELKFVPSSSDAVRRVMAVTGMDESLPFATD